MGISIPISHIHDYFILISFHFHIYLKVWVLFRIAFYYFFLSSSQHSISFAFWVNLNEGNQYDLVYHCCPIIKMTIWPLVIVLVHKWCCQMRVDCHNRNCFKPAVFLTLLPTCFMPSFHFLIPISMNSFMKFFL